LRVLYQIALPKINAATSNNGRNTRP
jgi:hypothetical protein